MSCGNVVKMARAEVKSSSFDGEWEDDDGTVAAATISERDWAARFQLEDFMFVAQVTIQNGEMRGADGIQIEAGGTEILLEIHEHFAKT